MAGPPPLHGLQRPEIARHELQAVLRKANLLIPRSKQGKEPRLATPLSVPRRGVGARRAPARGYPPRGPAESTRPEGIRPRVPAARSADGAGGRRPGAAMPAGPAWHPRLPLSPAGAPPPPGRCQSPAPCRRARHAHRDAQGTPTDFVCWLGSHGGRRSIRRYFTRRKV